MATQNTATTGPAAVAATVPEMPARPVTERAARSWPGLWILAAGIVAILAGGGIAVLASHQGPGAAAVLVVLCVLIFIASGLALGGLTPVVPGQARVVQLFG